MPYISAARAKMLPFVARPIYTSTDLAPLFGCHTSSINKSIDRGVIPGRRLPGSRHRRVDHSRLVRWLRQNPQYSDALDRLLAAVREQGNPCPADGEGAHAASDGSSGPDVLTMARPAGDAPRAG